MNSLQYAVIGNPIDHSLSPIIHNYFAAQTHIALSYEKIVEEAPRFANQVSDFFAAGGKGLNVTSPFKQQAFAMAQHTTVRAQIARSANTLWMHEDRLWADNTDGIGLIRDLRRHVDITGLRVLVLGAGGAAGGILGPLLDSKLKALVLANRTVAKAQALHEAFPSISCYGLDQVVGDFDVIINATSASLAAKTVDLNKACFANKPFCYDLAYSLDGPTAFLLHARNLGCEAVDGLGMLVEQAAESFYIWHKVMPATTPVLSSLRKHL